MANFAGVVVLTIHGLMKGEHKGDNEEGGEDTEEGGGGKNRRREKGRKAGGKDHSSF